MTVDPPIRPTTRALAAMQTAINRAGLALFDGDIDRFGIFSLIYAQTAGGRTISAYSLATSLGRSFETVRRHVHALVVGGVCVRIGRQIAIAPECLARPDVLAVHACAHDAFVRFVEELAAQGLLPALPAPTRAYEPAVGVAAAVDILLTAVASNRRLHDDWLSITIFSTVILANAERYAAAAPPPGAPLDIAHAVRPSVVARALNLPETTVRRRSAALTAPGGPLIRTTRGLLASRDWLDSDAAAEVSANTYAGIRLVLARAAIAGFPFDAARRAYLVGPPAMPTLR